MMNTVMKNKSTLNALVLASLATVTVASGTAFAAVPMGAGYEVAAMEAACGADKQKTDTADKAKEAKCGEAKCGADNKATADKAKEGKCGEGKCGADKKSTTDKAKEAKCGGAAYDYSGHSNQRRVGSVQGRLFHSVISTGCKHDGRS